MSATFLIALIFCLIVSSFGVVFMATMSFTVSEDKKNIYLIWASGFLLFVLSYVIEIFIISGSVYLRPYREMLKMSGNMMFMWGTILITAKDNFTRYFFPLIIWALGIIQLTNTSEKNIFIISSLFRAIAFLMVAYFFALLYNHTKSYGSAVLTIYFFLAAIYDFYYFLLRPIKWYAPFGFFLYGIFLLIIIYGFYSISGEEKEIVERNIFNVSLVVGIISLFFMIIIPFLLAKKIIIGMTCALTCIVITVFPLGILTRKKYF